MIILCYHELAEDESTPWRINPEVFRQHLQLIPEYLKTIPKAMGAVLITFDDGCKSAVEAAEMIKQAGGQGVFYICPGYIDGTARNHANPQEYMTWDDVRELAKHHIIGAHSMTHPPKFLDLSPDQRRWEMTESKRVIEQQVGRECRHWATPHGYYDAELATLAEDAGFNSLATTMPGTNRPFIGMHLQRWEVHSGMANGEFARRLPSGGLP